MSGDKAKELNDQVTIEYIVYSIDKPEPGPADERVLVERYRTGSPIGAQAFIGRERHNYTGLTILTVYS